MRLIVGALFLLMAPSLTANASTSPLLGAASGHLYNRADDNAMETSNTQRVRIPVTLKSWSEVDTTAADGKSKKTRIAGKSVSQVLRARIERSNDFYLGSLRVKTTPVRWLKRSNQYQVKLEVFRRYGEDSQLEESMGSVTLTGLLEKQDDGLYVLNGTARRLFRERTGEPLLDLEAGQHWSPETAPAISRL